MEYYPFPARLAADYNSILEYGDASVARDDNAIDFSAEFVPLVPLGAPATVEWIFGEGVVAAFTGSVYLSSPTLLRIVGVDPELIKAARYTFAMNTSIAATVSNNARQDGYVWPAQILYLSTNFVTLRASHTAEEGGSLYMSAEVDFLTLDALRLRVRRRVPLRRDVSLLLCEVIPGSDANTIALSAYSTRLEQFETE